MKQNINLIYTYLPSTYHKSYVLPGTLSPGQVDGMIVLNVYSNELLKKLSSLDIPKVFLDTTPAVPFDSLNGDLVLIEGKNTVRSITLSVIDSGIDDIIFIGDTEYAQTNMDRLWGFKQAVEERNLNIDMSRCLTGHLPLHAHYEEISRFLAALVPFPQAIICASDYIAHFVQRYCNTNDRAKNTIITGFDNNKEYRNVADCITTAHVQTDTLGTRLADKIIFRMVNKSASFEVAYISSKIIQNRHE